MGFSNCFFAWCDWVRNSNEVGERGAEELSEALRVNRRLESLDLGNNQSLGLEIAGRGLGESLDMRLATNSCSLSTIHNICIYV